MKRFNFLWVGILLWSGNLFAAIDIKLPVPELETLPNGLQLVWFTNDSLPVVDMALLVQSGSRDDFPGKSGTSQLVSNLLDRGAAGMSALEIGRAVEMLGASRYSSADDDTFTVGMHGLAPDALVLLDLLAKMVVKPDFPEAEVAKEHARLLERWSHMGDYGDSLAALAFQRLMTSGTEYGRGSFYSGKEYKGVHRTDVLAYHQANFTPKNAVLMIVGRVDRAEFRNRVLAAFGNWKGEAPNRDKRKYTDTRLKAAKGEVVLVGREDLTQAQVRMGFKAPLIQHPDHYSLSVANALIGEYFNSRLNSVIRDKLGLTYGIGSSFSYSKDYAKFAISSATRNESTGQLIRKTLDILSDLKKGTISVEEVQMAKEYLMGGFPLSVATLGSVASRWLSGYIFNLGPGYLNEFVLKISETNREQILKAVAKHMDLDQMTIVVAGDPKEIMPSLSESGFKKVKRVTVRDLQ